MKDTPVANNLSWLELANPVLAASADHAVSRESGTSSPLFAKVVNAFG